LKEFGFGQRVMETRILIEVEEMINKVRETQSRPFDIKQLTTLCMANVIMSISFGHRFDHSDPAFQQVISDVHEMFVSFSFAVELFPALRIFPYFKNSCAAVLRNVMSIRSFVSTNIDACLQVGNCTSRCTHNPPLPRQLEMFLTKRV